jgi:WD40 repeat protein
VSPAEGSIHVWDAETGKVVSAVTSPELVAWERAFAPDSQHLYTIEVSDPGIGVWDARTGKRVRTLSRLQVPATHLAVHPDGSRFVTAGRDGRLRVWDAASGEECLSLRLPVGDIPGWLTFSADGRRLGVVCFSGVVHVFDAPALPTGDPTPVREPATIPGIHGGAALKSPH